MLRTVNVALTFQEVSRLLGALTSAAQDDSDQKIWLKLHAARESFNTPPNKRKSRK